MQGTENVVPSTVFVHSALFVPSDASMLAPSYGSRNSVRPYAPSV